MSHDSAKKSKIKHSKTDDSGLSLNHSKSVKFRLRVQQQKEADMDIKQYQDTEEFEQYYKDAHDKPVERGKKGLL